ncbi:MAG TPA: hypothetical protein VKN99_00170 [Polyangia bacterium]|nr:hypothetical protein [Polyangia bacterium]
MSELRRIEEDRIKQEEEAERARVAAEQRARADAERRAREEEEARRREGEERAMRERLERERMDKEHHTRVQEAERRAKVEADARLREQQMHLEMQIKAKHPPIKAIVGVVGALFLVVCGLGYYMYTQHQEEQKKAQLQLQQKEEEAHKLQLALAEQQREAASLKKEFDDLQDQLKKATTQGERDAIQKRMDVVRQRARANAARVPASAQSNRPRVDVGSGSSTDPLEGLK